MGISILIVDDDRMIVEKVEEGIGWEALGIDTLLKAFNIRQAKKILGEVPVDILLSDIEMPQGNGLELLGWVREEGLDIECIFLSGFAYFAYAQKAIDLKSCAYLLKPISNRELEDTLAKVCESVRKKKGSDRVAEKRKVFWRKHIEEEVTSRKELEMAIREGIYHPDDAVWLVLFRGIPCGEGKERDVTLDEFIAGNVAAESFVSGEKEGELLAMIPRRDYEWIFVFGAGSSCVSASSFSSSFASLEPSGRETLPGDLWEKIIAYKAWLETSLSLKVFVFAGDKTRESKATSGRRLLEKASRELLPGKEDILFIGEWKHAGEYISPAWSELEKLFSDAARIPEGRERILAFIEHSYDEKRLTKTAAERFVREFIHSISRCLERQGASVGSVFDEEEYEAALQKASVSLPDLEDFIGFTCERLISFSKKGNRQEQMVEQLKQYILTHLSEDLSRKTLAGEVFLSEDYISRIFIAGTGLSIPAFVTRSRMEKARELLSYTNLSVSEVAMEVGYSNFSYFCKTFRDACGCTPNEFRARRKEKNNKDSTTG